MSLIDLMSDMKNKAKPTQKQLKTLELLQANPNLSYGEAMRGGGYSEKTSRTPGKNFLELEGTKTAIEEFKEKLAGTGITTEFMAKKYKEWLDAQKPFSSHTEPDKMVPDYETQLKVKDDVSKFIGLSNNEGNVKRRAVLEEYFDLDE